VKNIRDLNKDISRAFPKLLARTAENKEDKKETKREFPAALPAVIDKAYVIAAEARVLSGRIYRFIYPAQHTVDLDELQNPGLLVSLDALEAGAGRFEQALAKLPAGN
jgi:hypothetical protein